MLSEARRTSEMARGVIFITLKVISRQFDEAVAEKDKLQKKQFFNHLLIQINIGINFLDIGQVA